MLKKYKCVFIDRDGTINVDVKYLSEPEKLRIYEKVPEGIALLNENNFKVIIITNQSGIARGYFTKETLGKIHERLCKLLAEKNAYIDAIYYCPHHPDEGCFCRKPSTALFEKAIEDWNIDRNFMYVVGDRMLDIEAGYKIGAKTILVPEKGNEKLVNEELSKSSVKPNCICNNFYEAVLWILRNSGL